MISRMVSPLWQELAEDACGPKSVFGEGGVVAYIAGAAGDCVTLFSCAKVTTRNTLPFLLGPVAPQPGRFFYARRAEYRHRLGPRSNQITQNARALMGGGMKGIA